MGVIFHRLIPNFTIQGGSTQGTGTDGPGYKFPGVFSPKTRQASSSTTNGYFAATGVNATTSATISGKDVFTVIGP